MTKDLKTKPAMTERLKQVKNKKTGYKVKTMILGGVNLVCVLAMGLILNLLPKKAEEIKLLNSEKIKLSEMGSVANIENEVLVLTSKVEEIKAMFPDETGLLDFINQIDGLKKTGVVRSFDFVSDKKETDNLGETGLPLVIEFQGTEADVDQALRKIQTLPYLIRAINVEINREINKDFMRLKYGGILYVSNEFN